MKNKVLINYRDMFWKQMIIESVGEDVFNKIDEHIKKRIISPNSLEFAVFDSQVIDDQ